MEKKMQAKILLYDLEVTPILGWTYGLYQTNVLKVEKQPIIMSFSYRWYGTKKTHHVRITDKELSAWSDAPLAAKLRDLFDEADIVIAHNANRFDNKVANGAFLRNNLTPPSPYKTVDTLAVARSVAKFSSNSLDSLGELFNIGRKSDIKHSDLWLKCIAGNRAAWNLMKKYNNQDVTVLYNLYEKLRPYIKNHTNIGDLAGERGLCPKCGSPKLEKRGIKSGKQTYQCKNCYGWCNESTKKGNGRIVNA